MSTNRSKRYEQIHDEVWDQYVTPPEDPRDAYWTRNGAIHSLGEETVIQADAEAVAEEFRREDPEGPTYFVASRVIPPWLPVDENKEGD